MLVQIFAAFFILVSLSAALMCTQLPDRQDLAVEGTHDFRATAAPSVGRHEPANPCNNLRGRNRWTCDRAYGHAGDDDEPQEEPELD